MKKGYTGIKDAYGERIFDGSILVLIDEKAVYWRVTRGITGIWTKRRIDENFNELGQVELLQEGGGYKVIKDIARHKNLEILDSEIQWCRDCVACDLCEDKNTNCCYKSEFDPEDVEEKRIKYGVSPRKMALKANIPLKDYEDIVNRNILPEFRKKVRIMQALKYFEANASRPDNITDKDIKIFKSMGVNGITVGGSKALSMMDQISFMKALYPEQFK